MKSPRSSMDELPFSLARASLNFRRFNEQTLKALGLESLAPGYASVLHALEDLGDCTVSRLVEKTHLPNGTLSGLLDGLQNEGYLQRVDNPKDGRSWLIQLTPSGRQLCEKLQLRNSKVVGILREIFSETEAAELVRLLEKATERMRRYSPEEEAPAKEAAPGRKPGPRKR